MMSRFGLAPAIISSMLRRRTRSSGSPVRTWTCQGGVFMDDGARLALSMTSSITARHRLGLEATHAAAGLYQGLVFHFPFLQRFDAAPAACRSASIAYARRSRSS